MNPRNAKSRTPESKRRPLKQTAAKRAADMAPPVVTAPSKGKGRPTKYDPAYCGAVVICGRAGKSLDWFAREIDVSRKTLNNWAYEHPEFLQAIERAKTAQSAQLQDEAAASQNGPYIGYRLKLLANVAPQEFRDRAEIAGIPGGAPIPVVDMSMADAVTRYRAMLARAAAPGQAG